MACPVCDGRAADGDLCPAHRAAADTHNHVAHNDGHAEPDFLWTIALLLFIVFLLIQLGVLHR